MPFPLLQEEMDAIYDLDYMRTYHPAYEKYGGVPAIEEVQFSVISCRGCFGSCSFCAIHSHQEESFKHAAMNLSFGKQKNH